ncbi:MAG: hypothetical protein CL958_01185, partial [Euryarchaeota archaeon]|nr:hypothetical protein [Marinobacter sp.]
MSFTVAIVLKVSGKAWAEAPDGSRRLLKEGDALMVGERLVTADDGRVLLDFGYDQTTTIEGGVAVLASPEMATDFTPAPYETTVEDDSVAQALAAIEEALGSSIEEAEAPAAGLDGGSAGGSSFVRLGRIVETIAPSDLSVDLNPVQATEQPFDLEAVSGSAEATPEPGLLTIASVTGGTGDVPAMSISGSSTNLVSGGSVTVRITDQDGNTVTQTITVGPEGGFTAVIAQLSGLVDGPVTIEARATGADGRIVTDSTNATLDITDGSIDVTPNIDSAAQTMDLTGTTTDVAPGESVVLTVVDSEGNRVTTSAIVEDDGSFRVTDVDISSLVDGNLTVEATTTDRNGNALDDSDTGTLDAVAGDLTVAIDAIDNGASTLDLSGITTDVAPGSDVAVTITDADGNTVTSTATVAADGSYTLTGVDISSLVDGTLTVEATAIDRNGNTVDDTASGTLDAVTGDLTVAIDAIDNGTSTLDLSGTTTDVAPGSNVAINVTDADGNTVTGTATVAGDGSYSLTGVDISSLVDGDITVDA